MKQLKKDIENRLIEAGFSKPSINETDKTETKGTKVPFFTSGDFVGGNISIELINEVKNDSLNDGLRALNFSNGDYFLHAIRSKTRQRVKGKQLVKYLIVCEFKAVPIINEELI